MRKVVIGIFTILAIVFVIAATLRQQQVTQIKRLIGYSEEDVSWAVHQLEAESQRLEIALLRAGYASDDALREAALRYETFASRRDVLANGGFPEKLRPLTAYTKLMQEFHEFLAKYDPIVADGLDASEVEYVLAGVAALRKSTHELVLAENEMFNRFTSAERRQIGGVEQSTLALQIVIGVVIVCFTGYAVVVLRRAQRFESALAESEGALREALRKAEGASAAKTSFLANMSHELRTPLNAVIGFSEFLAISASDRLNERQRSYLADIRSSGQHLLELLSNILELAKLEAGKVDLQVNSISAQDLINECIRMLVHRAESAGITIRSCDLNILPHIQGDRTRLRQIFLNLLSNAIKYSTEGGRVRIVGRADTPEFATIQIEDEGIGMRPSDIEIALRPFERIKSAHSSNQEGAGLGLAIVKTLVDIHSGQLEIVSELGRGTTVTVRLPAGHSPHDARLEGSSVASSRASLSVDRPHLIAAK